MKRMLSFAFGLAVCLFLVACVDPSPPVISKVADSKTGNVVANGSTFYGKEVMVTATVDLRKIPVMYRNSFSLFLKNNGVVLSRMNRNNETFMNRNNETFTQTVAVKNGLNTFQVEARSADGSRSFLSNIYSITANSYTENMRFEDASKNAWNSFVQKEYVRRSAEISSKKIVKNGFVMDFCEANAGPVPLAERDRSLVVVLHGGGGPVITPNFNPGYSKNPASAFADRYRKVCQSEALRYAQIFSSVNSSQSVKVVFPIAIADASNQWYYKTARDMLETIKNDYAILGLVNPDRMYDYGVSAGGDGVFENSTHRPDLSSAVATVSGHPNDVVPEVLRNLPIWLAVGEKDTAYNRLTAYQNFDAKLTALRKQDLNGYVHDFKIFANQGHTDGGQIGIMQSFRFMGLYSRNPNPLKIVYEMPAADLPASVYWVEFLNPPAPGAKITAERSGNAITLTTDLSFNSLRIYLKDLDTLNLDQAVKVTWNGKVVHNNFIPRTHDAISRSIELYQDPSRIYTASLVVNR